jgi:hypothetical protein
MCLSQYGHKFPGREVVLTHHQYNIYKQNDSRSCGKPVEAAAAKYWGKKVHKLFIILVRL